MSNKRTRSSQALPPHGADDFRLINGVGLGHARRLYAVGITTFAQLGALSPDELVAQLDRQTGLTAARVIAEDWLGQARALAERRATDEKVEPLTGAIAGLGMAEEALTEPLLDQLSSAQHHASFAITLALDTDNTVARTRVTYARPEGGEERDSWIRWDAERLLRFIVQHSRLKLPADEPEPVEQPAHVSQPEPTKAEARVSAEAALAAARVLGDSPAPRLQSLVPVPEAASFPQHVLADDMLYSVELGIDLSELFERGEQPRCYAVTVHAKRLGSGRRLAISRARGSVAAEAALNVVTSARTLAAGLYRLEVDLELGSNPDEPPQHTVSALAGDLILIY